MYRKMINPHFSMRVALGVRIMSSLWNRIDSFHRFVMRDNDNCGWRQGWRVTSAGVREGETVAARTWLHCFK